MKPDRQILPGPIESLLAADHARLNGLLQSARRVPGQIDADAYDRFRRGLLRHIAMEEKMLFPAARTERGGEALPAAARLRMDHGAIAALLVLSPTPRIAAALAVVIERHNPLEEGADGVYRACDLILGERAQEIADKLAVTAEVPVSSYNDTPNALASAKRALARAGYADLLGP